LFELGGRKRLAYLTDCHAVPDEAVAVLRGVDLAVIDALREKGHASHLTFDGALDAIEAIQPQRALFTHICHEGSHAAIERKLPPSVRVAFDGMKVSL
jgi:phosphoribosyl 1,2-cyclic phosphate phosphodiesterase